jgi:hypothetical protein
MKYVYRAILTVVAYENAILPEIRSLGLSSDRRNVSAKESISGE